MGLWSNSKRQCLPVPLVPVAHRNRVCLENMLVGLPSYVILGQVLSMSAAEVRINARSSMLQQLHTCSSPLA
eukprot:3444919-Amphidinium_carterae.1